MYVDFLTSVVVNPAWQSREWGLFLFCLLIGWPPLPVPPPPTPYNLDHPSVTSTSFATHSSQTVLQKYQSRHLWIFFSVTTCVVCREKYLQMEISKYTFTFFLHIVPFYSTTSHILQQYFHIFPASVTSGCSVVGTSSAALWRFLQQLKSTYPPPAEEWTVCLPLL